jgi:hypothetical protein
VLCVIRHYSHPLFPIAKLLTTLARIRGHFFPRSPYSLLKRRVTDADGNGMPDVSMGLLSESGFSSEATKTDAVNNPLACVMVALGGSQPVNAVKDNDCNYSFSINALGVRVGAGCEMKIQCDPVS